MMVSVCFASNVYEVGNDVDLDATIYWPSDYKISMLAFDDADSTMLEWIYDMLTDIWNDMRAGFEFVDEDIVAGNSLLSQINVTGNSMYTLVDGMDSTLDYVLQGVGQTNGYLAITNNRLSEISSNFLSYFTVPAGYPILNTDGTWFTPSSSMPFWNWFRYNIFGLSKQISNVDASLDSLFLSSGGGAYLGIDGRYAEAGESTPTINLLRYSMLGLRSLLAGSESDNVYQGTSINNENMTSTFSATGLGPMLNTWLGDIQNDLGVLSYVFASPQDLDLKEKSSDNMTQVGDSLLSPDSASSVKVSDIAGISEASTAIKGFGDTGVSIGQAFAQLGDASLFRFFSAEAASDLDTSVSMYSRNATDRVVTNYYADSRDEFYSIINGGEE